MNTLHPCFQKEVLCYEVHRQAKSLPYHSSEIEKSNVSIGFECLDRELFNPERCYDWLGKSGVKVVMNTEPTAQMIRAGGSDAVIAATRAKINIPGMFYAYNDQKRFQNVKPARYENLTKDAGKASDCIGCGQCTAACPQRLIIPDLLDDVAKVFEK